MKRVTLLAAALLAQGLAAQAPEQAGGGPRRVQLLTAQEATPERAVAATVVAATRATVSTRVAAAVRVVHVEEGVRVAQGQLLVTLADDDLQAQLRAARAALESVQAQERRLTSLLTERAATQAEVDQAKAQRVQAEAAVQGLVSQLDYTRVRAPFAGVVQARRVSAGDLVAPGTPLYELDGAGLELSTSLSGEELLGLHLGQHLSFESGGETGEAQVTALVPGGDPVSHRSSVKARILRAPKTLRTGAVARLGLPRSGEAALYVPRASLLQRGDLHFVFVPEEGLATMRILSLGDEDQGRVRVRAGLHAGERFVADPRGLRDGLRIEVVP